jgi:type VI secretion system secreted protein VgrG
VERNDLFRLEGDALPASTRVLAIDGIEALSKPYKFAVDIATLGEDDCAFEPGDTLGKRVSLVILDESGEARTRIHGVIAGAELTHAMPSDAFYRVTLAPQLWFLSLDRHSRVFVKESIPQIIEKVLGDAGLKSGDDFELRLVRPYPKREHVCQYAESNLTFVSRWMEREGIYYFFEQGDDKEKLIITDDKTKHQALDSKPLRYFPLAGAQEAFYTFRAKHASLPEKVRLDDYNDMRPNQDISVAVRLDDYNDMRPDQDISVEAPAADLGVGVLSIFGENFADSDAGKRLVKVRAEELLTGQLVLHGAGRVYEVRSGYRLKLEAHPRSSMNQEYLAVRVRHRGYQGGPGSDSVKKAGYRVNVKAIKADTQFRPRRITPKPRINGLETGVIDGPDDQDYALLDEHGRYFVKFHFDESDLKDGKASTRVRMLQPHAGNPEGFHFPLRKGTEVHLAFVGGDPDRPLIVGAVPNPLNPNMVTKDNATHNVLQTGGETRIEIEDQKDKQYIDISTPSKSTRLHLGEENNAHKHNFVLATDGNGLIHAGRDHDLMVTNNQKVEVGANRNKHVRGNEVTTIGAKREHVVKGEDHLTVEKERFATITGVDHLEVKANREVKIAEKDSVETKNKSTTVKEGYDISANERFHVKQKGAELKLTGEHVELKAPAYIKLGVPSSVPTGATGEQASVEATADGKLLMNAIAAVTIECGGCRIEIKDGGILLSAPRGIKLAVDPSTYELSESGVITSAPKVSTSGTAMVEICGPMVKVN